MGITQVFFYEYPYIVYSVGEHMGEYGALRTLDLIPCDCCIGPWLKATRSSVLCIEVACGSLLKPPEKSWSMATTF